MYIVYQEQEYSIYSYSNISNSRLLTVQYIQYTVLLDNLTVLLYTVYSYKLAFYTVATLLPGTRVPYHTGTGYPVLCVRCYVCYVFYIFVYRISIIRIIYTVFCARRH